MSCSNCVYSDNYHSRIESRQSMDSLRENLSHIPQIKWKCPPKFVLSHKWHVAAGDESKEKETQKHREMRVLEAVYPRLSDIPPSPSLPLDVQECHHDDSHIPLIPVTPIEDEGAVDLSSEMAAAQNASFDLKSPALPQALISGHPNAPQCELPASLKPSANEKPALEVLRGFQAEVVAAAAAAIAAIMKSKEQVNLIDTNLLIKFLSDPKMIEKLINEQGVPASTKTERISGSKPLTASMPLPSAKPSLVEEVISEGGTLVKTGSISVSRSTLVTPSVAISCPKPDPVIKKLTNEQGTAANAGATTISGSNLVTPLVALPSPKPDPVIDKLIHKHQAPTNTGAAPVSGSKSATSRFAFPSPGPDALVNKLTKEHAVPTNPGRSAPFSQGKLATPLASLPSSKPDLVKIKRMINEYGILEDTENEPLSRSRTSNLQVPMSSPKLDVVVLPAWINSHPLPNTGGNGLQLKNLSPDAARPNLNTLPNVLQPDLRLKAVPPDTARLNFHPLPIVVQPGLQRKTLSPDTVPISSFSAMTAPLLALSPDDTPRLNLHPLPNMVQPGLQMKALSPDTVPMSSISAMTAPLVKDINYIKGLIKQHGEMQQTQDCNLLQSDKFHVHLQDPQPVPTLKPNELTPKVQKPCIFFNGPKGCRNGSNCLFRHDKAKNSQPGGVTEAPSAKKMKLGGATTGRI